MKSMKILIIMIAVFTLIFAGGCEAGTATNEQELVNHETVDGKISITATLFPQYDFAREIGGELVEVTLLLPPGMEAHSFEPTPKDIVSLSKTDIFLYTGEAMEPWAANIVENLKSQGVLVVDLSEDIPALKLDDHVNDQGDEDGHEDGDHGVDPHYWTDPNMAVIMADSINTALHEEDPENSAYYTENTEILKEKLIKLDQDIRDVVDHSKSNTILSGGHFAFGYFAHRYGLEHMSPYEGFSPNSEPSPKSIASLMETIASTNAQAIFYEELADPKVARVIAEETGIQILLLHGVHNVSIDDLESGKGYIDFMYENLENLKIGLGYDE